MRKSILLLGILIFFSSVASCQTVRTCSIRYETENGYSEPFLVKVVFQTGRELNKKTKSYIGKYKNSSNYASIWWDKGKVTIIELDGYLFNIGNYFDDDDFESAFSMSSTPTGEDQEHRKWKIDTKNGMNFYDE